MLVQHNIFTEELKYLFRLLIDNGDEVRLVGGCVRNYILGLPINDYDIATKYTPEKVIDILDKNNIKYYKSGINFGTVTAVINSKNFEITTLRRDIKTDGRHALVKFTDNYEEDAERRDFTFNALYCNVDCRIYDYFDGISDLKKGIIRFIGDPEKRILEDYLRILRFFRFYSYYSYSMDYSSLQACTKHREKIKNLSKERVSSEFHKILECAYPTKTLKIMQHHGILKYIIDCDNLIFSSLDIFCSLKNYINFSWNYLFIVALIVYENNINYNLLLSKKDKNFIKNILPNIPKIINEFEIKKLLFILKGDRKTAKNIVMIYICNNYNKNLLKYLDLIDIIETPKLKITGYDLENFGFTNKKLYSKILSSAYEVFIESNFTQNKGSILKLIKN